MNFQTFSINTFGCQMNKSDSDLIKLSLKNGGYLSVDNEENADIVVYNTCSVRENAENRVISRLKSLKKDLKKRNGIIIVTGCMAQNIGNFLLKEKIADIIVGPYQSPDLAQIIELYKKSKKNSFLSQEENDFENRINNKLINSLTKNEWHQWVTITHGCENFCTYCIVPKVRGKLISFPSNIIIDYSKNLAQKGIKEVTLLGQNVNQYGQDNNDIPFYKLLEKISEIKGLLKINFLTSHPKDFSEDIVKVIKNSSNISRAIHLPIQSGSDEILKKMNRKYTTTEYFQKIEIIDKHLKNYSISTDIIVGFPGETEANFQETLNVVKKIKFDEAYMYAYSKREGTPASKLKEELTRKEKIERLNRLIYIQREISLEKLKKRIGKVEDVIVEKTSKKSSSELLCKTFLNHPVIIKGNPEKIGENKKVKITGISGSTLQGVEIE